MHLGYSTVFELATFNELKDDYSATSLARY